MDEARYWESVQRSYKFYLESFKRGKKRALMDAIVLCAMSGKGLRLPAWVAIEILKAHEQYNTGKLRSWDDVFGKPFPGKSRAGLATRARSLEIWQEVRRRREQGQPTGDRLWEDAGKALGIGGKTVRNIYYKMKPR